MAKELEVHQISNEEVRRGWVRIEENTRDRIIDGGIDSGSIALIRCGHKETRRIILGIQGNYLGIVDTSDMIFMDEGTRNELEVNNIGKKYEFEIEVLEYTRCNKIKYYLNHPDPYISFATTIAVRLGILSTILGVISFILAIISILLAC
jgi:hypothetical protein